MKLILTILMSILMSGCATVYPECVQHAEESAERAQCQLAVRDYRRGIDNENWITCAQTLDFEVHTDHLHGPRDKVYPADIKSDLAMNRCQNRLGKYWAEY